MFLSLLFSKSRKAKRSFKNKTHKKRGGYSSKSVSLKHNKTKSASKEHSK